MSRKLIRPILSLPLWGLMFGWCAVAAAQPMAPAQPAAPQGAEPQQVRPAGGADLQVQDLPPRLNQLLTAWAQESAKIQRLQGKHRRFVYDKVFMTEKRADGWFYYEAPDKGRIDLIPLKVAPNAQGSVDPATKKPYELKQDQPERWICNGRDVRQINDAEKKVEIFPIPPQAQGTNIMDGPLPFLFGMPPEKAKLRYRMKLSEENQRYAYIDVEPRLQQDAANWKKAQLILDKKTWMPWAVKLIDPTGNTETAYVFDPESLEINKETNSFLKFLGVGEKDPFNPNLAGYTPNVIAPQGAPAGAPPQPLAPPALPNLVNMPYLQARQLLEKAGCTVTLAPGPAPPQDGLALVVTQQSPTPGVPLKEGLAVTLTSYSVGATLPNLEGYKWSEIGEMLQKAGYKVKSFRGKVAPTPEQVFAVQAQKPDAGAKLTPGDTINLQFYTAPTAANATAEK